jgi:hypothetical protein
MSEYGLINTALFVALVRETHNIVRANFLQCGAHLSAIPMDTSDPAYPTGLPLTTFLGRPRRVGGLSGNMRFLFAHE